MKNFAAWAPILGLALLFATCNPKEEDKRNQAVFAGVVTSSSGEPLAGVKVWLNESAELTNEEGKFQIGADSAEKYLMKARKKGYSSNTGVYLIPKEDLRIRLYAATVESFDASQDIFLTDQRSKETQGPALNDGELAGMFPAVPVVYKDGQVSDFGFSPEMEEAFNYVKSRDEAGPGMSISIPANSLTRNGSPAKGMVDVSVSTIDIFSPGAMPGDMTIVDENGNRSGFMISLGAGSIEVFDEEGDYQLNEKMRAKISIPVDPSALKNDAKIPDTIPLFYYLEDKGFWIEDGFAILDRRTRQYNAELRHFSTFNMDFKISDPSCLQFRQNAPGGSTFSNFIVETILVFGGSPVHTERNVTDPSTSGGWPVGDNAACLENSNGTGFHMLYNLPENTEVCLIFYEPGTPNIARGMSVTTTGPSYGATLPTCSDLTCTCPGECNAPIAPCLGYAPCNFVPLSVNPSLNVVLAANVNGADVNIKWVHNENPAAFVYQLFEEDFIGGGAPTLVHTENVSAAVDPRDVFNIVLSGVSSGQHVYTLSVDVGGTIFTSNQVDITVP